MMPRAANGSVTVRKAVADPAPSERAASRMRTSTARNESSLASTVYGGTDDGHHEDDPHDRVVDGEADRVRRGRQAAAGEEEEEETEPDEKVRDDHGKGHKRLDDRVAGEGTPREEVAERDAEHDGRADGKSGGLEREEEGARTSPFS